MGQEGGAWAASYLCDSLLAQAFAFTRQRAGWVGNAVAASNEQHSASHRNDSTLVVVIRTAQRHTSVLAAAVSHTNTATSSRGWAGCKRCLYLISLAQAMLLNVRQCVALGKVVGSASATTATALRDGLSGGRLASRVVPLTKHGRLGDVGVVGDARGRPSREGATAKVAQLCREGRKGGRELG